MKKTKTSVRLLEIQNVTLGPSHGDGRVALACEYEGARYHVWLKLDTLTLDPEEPLYKNPTVERDNDEYFNTRELKQASRFASSLIDSMLDEMKRKNLYAHFEAQQAKEEAERNSKAAEAERVKNIVMAAGDLYDACKVAFRAVAGHDTFQDVAKVLDLAIKKAEGRS